MSFSYDVSLADNVSLVRFHIGDTEVDGYFLDDETISYWNTELGDANKTVIYCIEYIISQLSQPNFRLDWMRVDSEAAAASYRELLELKRQELGVPLGGTNPVMDVGYPYRADSNQSTDEEYDGS